MPNKLIVIGWIGTKRAYLNIPREDAIKRFCDVEDETPTSIADRIREFEFDDEFNVYDAWETS